MKRPTKLKKMKLSSVDFVRRGANPAADIALYKSDGDITPEEEELEKSFFKSLSDSVANAVKKAFGMDEEEDELLDIKKAEQDLIMFAGILGESFSSIMKDDTLSQKDRVSMVEKSVSEFTDTVDDYLSSFSITEKSAGSGDEPPVEDPQTAKVTQKSITNKEGDDVTMAKSKYENVDKSLLSPEDAATLEALIAKANGKEEVVKEEDPAAGKVDPAKAQEEEEKNADLPPAVKKALEDVENLRKSIEMKEFADIAKKYEVLGKKADEEAKVLYDLKKSGDGNYNAYIAALDAQVALVEKSGLFAEIGKSGNFNYTAVTKSDAEAQIDTIAKSYQAADPTLNYADAVTKAWENNPQLFAEYEQSAGF